MNLPALRRERLGEDLAVAVDGECHAANAFRLHAAIIDGEAELTIFFVLTKDIVFPVNNDLIIHLENIVLIWLQAACHVNSYAVGFTIHDVTAHIEDLLRVNPVPATFRLLSFFIDSVLKTHVVCLHAISRLEPESELFDGKRAELSWLVAGVSVPFFVISIAIPPVIGGKTQFGGSSLLELNFITRPFACGESHFVVCSAIVVEELATRTIISLDVELECLRLVLVQPIRLDEVDAFAHIEFPLAVSLVLKRHGAPLVAARWATLRGVVDRAL